MYRVIGPAMDKLCKKSSVKHAIGKDHSIQETIQRKVERRNKEKRNETDEQKENYKNATGTYHFDTQKNIENSSRQNQKKEKNR